MNIYAEMATKIIKEQQAIIGPVAYEQAKKISGLKVDEQKSDVILEGNEKEILEKLVEKYQHLFGQASVEVCKEAIKGFQVPSDSLPVLLK